MLHYAEDHILQGIKYFFHQFECQLFRAPLTPKVVDPEEVFILVSSLTNQLVFAQEADFRGWDSETHDRILWAVGTEIQGVNFLIAKFLFYASASIRQGNQEGVSYQT